jgi:Ca2+-binding EF-hand superfamily protein
LALLGLRTAGADEAAQNAQPATSGVVVPTAVVPTAVVPAAAVAAASSEAVSTTGLPTILQPAASRPADGLPIDLAILLDRHIVTVRLNVRYAGAPYGELWQQFADSRFDSADTDHNGLLDAEEFAAGKPLVTPAPSNTNNRNQVQLNRRRGQGTPVVDPADEVENNREMIPEVTRQEFVEFLRTGTNGPVRIEASFLPSASSRALFRRLDTDHDEKLSVSECEHALETLRPLDLEEADVFTQNQLLTGTGNASTNGNFYFAADDMSQRATPVRLAAKLLRFSGPALSAAWADRIRQHFAAAGTKTNAERNLRRSVMLYDPATLATIDADNDGALDQAELAHLQWSPIPNLELTVDQGGPEPALSSALSALSAQATPARARNRGPVQPPVRTGTIESTRMCLDREFRFEPAVQSHGFNLPATLTMGGEQIEISASGFVAANAQRRGAQLVNNLKRFDSDKNDYLDEKELRRFGQNNGFMALDTNGDGKLYFSEIEEYVEAQTAAAAVRLLVTVVDHDHGLFESLDNDRDGRLARRELGQLASRVAAWDRDGDGQLAFDEVPRIYTVQVGQDQPQIPLNRFFGFNNFAVNESRRAPSQRGPNWFTQMDRNSDGDVSRREFLGTASQFRSLDADGDQLIDADEAVRAAPPARPPAAEKTEPASTPAAEEAK